ncbi:MAG TPA: HEAT repeat domain-containing protein [Pyrinomonadaceae bacterium]
MRGIKLQPAAAAFGRLAVCVRHRAAVLFFLICLPQVLSAQTSNPTQLTPLQIEIEKQRQRLDSKDVEERRDAVMRLGWMSRPESSRQAATGLRDSSAMVRATAARAVLSLPPDEAAALLLPLVQDRDEFVRQETAYALGETRSRTSVSSLVNLLERDKRDGVRGAAAVALGQIGDEAAVIPLVQLISQRLPASGIINRVRRKKKDENEFIRRAAAHSLGQIRSRAAVPALIEALEDERAPDDLRREAAASLGLIGDTSAVTALRGALTARDPYLSRTAFAALLKIAPTEATRPAAGQKTP